MNSIKVLLATLSIEPTSRVENNPNAAYSLGLAYIQAVLEKEEHDTRLLFLNNYDNDYSEKAFFDCFDEYQPQIVAFQIFSMNRTSTFRAIEKIRQKSPSTRIIIGGVHTSVMYRQIIDQYPGLVAVIGEGEYTVKDLVGAFESNAPLGDINGIAYYSNEQVVTTEPRELIADLDSLPFPKHETFFELEPERSVAHIIASRGCPFNCTFCCLKVISKRKYRKRDINKVVDEIRYIKEKYPQLRHVQLHDDTFLLDNERVIQFCKMIIDLDMQLTFECSARVKPISSEMFHWMEKAGFKKIMFGLETGSDKLLDSIHKKITKEDVFKLFDTLKPFDITITTFLMCGFPGEDMNTIHETIELVQNTQKIHYNLITGVGILWVYPGTEVYEIMKNSGEITDDFWMSDEPVPYFTVEHDVNELIEYENIILDHVSLYRILTFSGFKNHFLVMPTTIIRFILKNRNLLPTILAMPIKLHFPELHTKIQRLYNRIK
ncbi:B12-binding domain-containing radical SAM protein [uncultured Methanolobus sp.]|uniref:B12-binding domain-containing radical SAM protein n=1 Tax=uncultured Methanolobus sp. TaxID=218300 RepID=UPI002AAA774B|nr:radical SAM protein [uncultured Methanolobus sp.]